MDKILYVMDPLCGWSYGNSENAVSFYNEFKDEYEIELLSGGIKIGEEVTCGGDKMEEYIRRKGKRIAQVSGMEFTDVYYKNLVTSSEYQFNSVPSSRAIASVKLLNSDLVFAYADRLQKAQFIDGKDNNAENILADIAESLGIIRHDFLEKYRSEKSLSKMNEDFKLVRTMNVTTFPSLYLQIDSELVLLGKGYMTESEMVKSLTFCFKRLKEI